ncbi:MAG: response regulator [Candidatus Krumholzibacteriota bacterium]|nr:response regulator [Candidatus Krumholzibacteriota bacterium]
MSVSILVVDDDPNVVEILTESFRGKGYDTECAHDGDEALRKYDEFQPDLVLLDVMLPGRDGFRVCDDIRSRDIHRDIPIIMISADTIHEKMLRGFSSGAQDYIKKPFSLKEIHLKVENFISQASHRRGLREQNLILEDEVQKGHADYMRINRELKKKVLDMQTLFGLSQDLNRLLDPDELIHVFALTVIGQLGLSSVVFFYAAQDRDEYLTYGGGKGVQENVLHTVRLARTSGLAAYLRGIDDIADLDDAAIPGEALQEARFMADLGFSRCYPLIVKEKLLGIVFIGAKINGQLYTDSDDDIFKSICRSAATGLENSRLYLELQSTYLSTIKVLVSTIEAKDSYTRGHTERVALYATLIAEEMGLSKRDREIVSFGAALHDIGKLGVYEDILNKPGELTENEWEIVRSHPEVGANIIKDMPFLSDACDLVRHHHERLDGNGYPDKLDGNEISLGARIVAVADSFDAMTSDRPYREAFDFDEAFRQLKKQGEKFDLSIVSYLEEIVRKGKIRQMQPA